MTTTKSYSNTHRFSVIYKKALKQGLPFALICAIGSSFLLLVPLLSELSDMISPIFGYRELPPGSWASFLTPGGALSSELTVLLTVCLGGGAFILAVFYSTYLHSKQKIDFYHSLPVTRTQLFHANTLAGMTNLIVPFVLVTLVTVIIEAISFPQDLNAQFYLLTLVQILQTILYTTVVFLFVTLIAMNVGTIFDTVIISVIMGFLPMIVYGIFIVICDGVLVGYVPPKIYTFFFSPFTFIFQGMATYFSEVSADTNIHEQLYTFGYGLILLIVFYIATYFSYKVRKSEMASEKIADGWPQIVTKILVGFCGAFFFTILFSDQLNYTAIFPALIGAILFATLAEVILSRGFSGMKKNIKWILLSGVLFVALFIGIKLDLTGYSSRIPETKNIVSINMSYGGRYEDIVENPYPYAYDRSPNTQDFSSPESIEIIREAHQFIVDGVISNGSSTDYYDSYTYYSPTFSVTYNLKNGSTIKRLFSYYPNGNDVSRILSKLDNQIEFLHLKHPFFFLPEEFIELQQVSLQSSDLINGKTLTLTQEEKTQLVHALKKDMEHEVELGHGNTDQVSLGVLHTSVVDTRTRPIPEENSNHLVYQETNGEHYTVSVVLTEDYTNTLALLKSWKMGDLLHPITEVKVDSIEVAYRYDDRQTKTLHSLEMPFMYNSVYDTPDYLFYTTESTKEIKELQTAIRGQIAPSFKEEGQPLYAVRLLYQGKVVGYGCVPSDLLSTELQGLLLAKDEEKREEERSYYEYDDSEDLTIAEEVSEIEKDFYPDESSLNELSEQMLDIAITA